MEKRNKTGRNLLGLRAYIILSDNVYLLTFHWLKHVTTPTPSMDREVPQGGTIQR